jgi:hypothetical protein
MMKNAANPREPSDEIQNLLSISALFKGTFSIDWLLELLAEWKPSQILSHLE